MSKSLIAQFIEERGGPSGVAAKLSERPATVRMWRYRNRLPRSKWLELMEAFPDLTVEKLAQMERAA